ncbi:hypothetical protein ACM66B_006817 [Microbotryomycetes sp. NB124-2]
MTAVVVSRSSATSNLTDSPKQPHLVHSTWSSPEPSSLSSATTSTQPSPVISDSSTISTSTTPKANQPSQLEPALEIVDRIAGPPATVGLSSTLYGDRSAPPFPDLRDQETETVDYLAAIERLDELEDEREAAEQAASASGSQPGTPVRTNSVRASVDSARHAGPSASASLPPTPSTPPRSSSSSANGAKAGSTSSSNASPLSTRLFHSPSASLRRKLKQQASPLSRKSKAATQDDSDDKPDCTCEGGNDKLEFTRSPRAASILSGNKETLEPAPEMSDHLQVAKLPFERFALPTKAQIEIASKCLLVGESGQSVEFGELIRERGSVVVVFLRHLWCGLCQQYVKALRQANHALHATSTTSFSTSSSRNGTVPAASTSTVPLYILLVSSGSPALIPIYRSRLDCPFPLYVDRKRTLYKALGMTLKSWNPGSEKDKGSYVQISMGQNVATSLKSAFAMRGAPGSQTQLGGEFVFTVNESESDEIRCSFASRMNSTRSHAEVRELFAAAGVHLSDEDASSVFGTIEESG